MQWSMLPSAAATAEGHMQINTRICKDTFPTQGATCLLLCPQPSFIRRTHTTPPTAIPGLPTHLRSVPPARVPQHLP